MLEALAAQLGTALEFASGEQPFLHPGRSAAVSVGGASAGWLGEIHPLVCRAWDLDAAVGFEIDAAPLLAAASAGEESYEDVDDLPRRLPGPRGRRPDRRRRRPRCGPRSSPPVASCCTRPRSSTSIEGEQLGEGRKSLALNLEFRAPDRTLTDEEVAAQREAIKASLEKIGGALRE